MVGASGAIAGVMGAYLIKFPRARILTLVVVILFITRIDIPAVLIFGTGSSCNCSAARPCIAETRIFPGRHRRFSAHIGGFVARDDPGEVSWDAQTRYYRRAATFTGNGGVHRSRSFWPLRPIPDDVEQTCGGTLLRMAEAGYRTGILDLTAGDMGTRGSHLKSAFPKRRRGPKSSGSHRENMRFPDARLENSMAGRMTLAAKIRELRPGPSSSLLGGAASRSLSDRRDRLRSLLPRGSAKVRSIHGAPSPVHKMIYSSPLCQCAAVFRSRRVGAVRPAHGIAVRLPVTIRRVTDGAADLFPDEQEIRERLSATARYYGNLIGVKYGEPFVVKETMRMDDIAQLQVRTF